jgi:peptidoglycan/xylan/chitin deacetylase (PgdA/CDA1 family)
MGSWLNAASTMDHTLYRYRAPDELTGQTGPTRLQAFALLILEHWDADPAPDARRDPRFVGEYGSFDPDFRSWTQREYGLRIGVFRVLDALKEAGIRAGVAMSARLVERLPGLVDRLSSEGVEWIGHGIAANQLMHSGMTIAEQREHIDHAVSTLTRATGRPPTGWLSQDWGTTPDTFGLLARAGLSYTLDWCNDDRPFALLTEPPLAALPLSPEWDDVQCQWLRNLEPRAHAALTEAAFTRLRSECANGRGPACFGLPIHPWVSGMPSRIGALRSLLARLASAPDADWRLPGEVLAHLAEACSIKPPPTAGQAAGCGAEQRAGQAGGPERPGARP